MILDREHSDISWKNSFLGPLLIGLDLNFGLLIFLLDFIDGSGRLEVWSTLLLSFRSALSFWCCLYRHCMFE